jgi:hypothetical protein
MHQTFAGRKSQTMIKQYEKDVNKNISSSADIAPMVCLYEKGVNKK